MPHKDFLFPLRLVSVRCYIYVFKKRQFILIKPKSDLYSRRTNQNRDLLLLFHAYIIKLFQVAKMNCSFQEPFLARIRQLIEIRNVRTDNTAVFNFNWLS